MELEEHDRALLLEALEELMYKLSLELNDLKGGPLNARRKELTKRQKEVEKLQHTISSGSD